MAYVIDSEKCTSCGTCADGCPETAIAYSAKKMSYQIDPAKCVDCGACKDNCGSDAIGSG